MKRINTLLTYLDNNNISCALITSSIAKKYLFGIDKGIFLINNRRINIFLHNMFLQDKNLIKRLNTHNIKISNLRTFAKTIKEQKTIAIEKDNTTLTFFYRYLKNKKIKDITPVINDIILKKNNNEITSLKKLSKLTEKIFSEFFNHLLRIRNSQKYISERELCFFIKKKILDYSMEESFPIIIAFNKNSIEPHHRPTNKKINFSNTKNLNILIDFGIKANEKYNFMNTDITRNIFIGNKKRLKEKLTSFSALLDLRNRITKLIKPNVNIKNIASIYKQFLEINNLEYLHSLGHFIGKEVHEEPINFKTDRKFINNCCFCIEPALYNKKFGIRIEDIYYIHNRKLTPLTKHPDLENVHIK